jgi:predicted nucleic acid-binding protein
MLAVSNTSPLSNLAIIGRLDLLQQRYGVVRIPPAVAQELGRLSHPQARALLTAALSSGWLQIDSASTAPLRLAFKLDPGESAAIALALTVKADVLLMDEKGGRAAARQLRLTVAGVLGELLHARIAGTLPSLRTELQRLRAQAGFFIDAGIEQFILSQVGE